MCVFSGFGGRVESGSAWGSSWSWWFLLALRRVLGSVVRVESSALAVGGESGCGIRDADWRHRSAGCVARTCASMWRAPERARRPRGRPESAAAILAAVGKDVATHPSRHHEGAGNLQRSRGALSVTQVPRHKGLRTLSGSLVFEGSLFFLLNECWWRRVLASKTV